jgi:hypothetical protein
MHAALAQDTRCKLEDTDSAAAAPSLPNICTYTLASCGGGEEDMCACQSDTLASSGGLGVSYAIPPSPYRPPPTPSLTPEFPTHTRHTHAHTHRRVGPHRAGPGLLGGDHHDLPVNIEVGRVAGEQVALDLRRLVGGWDGCWGQGMWQRCACGRVMALASLSGDDGDGSPAACGVLCMLCYAGWLQTHGGDRVPAAGAALSLCGCARTHNLYACICARGSPGSRRASC